MAKYWMCPHADKVQRKLCITTHCLLKGRMDVSYFCYDKNKDKVNPRCPLNKKERKESKNVRN